MIKIKSKIDISQAMQDLRDKPTHVRERLLMLALAVVAAMLLFVWFMTFHFNSTGTSRALFQRVGSGLSGTLDDSSSASANSASSLQTNPPSISPSQTDGTNAAPTADTPQYTPQ